MADKRCRLYIDITKAFDSIVLSKLLLKLELYGISGISGFLTNMTQCVVIITTAFQLNAQLSAVCPKAQF
jgi:hypothetical protein